jgi:hypothetical protein
MEEDVILFYFVFVIVTSLDDEGHSKKVPSKLLLKLESLIVGPLCFLDGPTERL